MKILYVLCLIQSIGVLHGSSIDETVLSSIYDPQQQKEVHTTDYSVPWVLLELSGNSSRIFSRYSEFLLYLKLNLASLTDSSFDLVRINSLSFTPTLLINVSLDANSNITVLRSLAVNKDSILEFSGETFKIVSVVTEEEILAPRRYQVLLDLVENDNFFIILGVCVVLALFAVFSACTVFSVRRKEIRQEPVEADDPPIFYTKIREIPAGRGGAETPDSSHDSVKLYREDLDIVSENTSLQSETYFSYKSLNSSNFNVSKSSIIPTTAIGTGTGPPTASKPRWKRPKPAPPPRSDSLLLPNRSSRPLSVPAPCHLSAYETWRPSSCSTLNQHISRQEIEDDVSFVLSTLDLGNPNQTDF